MNDHGLKYKIPGNNPYKCIISAFNIAGFERTNGIIMNKINSFYKKIKYFYFKKFES
jgi:hypothetical protein